MRKNEKYLFNIIVIFALESSTFYGSNEESYRREGLLNGIRNKREDFVLDTSFCWEETNEGDNDDKIDFFFDSFVCFFSLLPSFECN